MTSAQRSNRPDGLHPSDLPPGQPVLNIPPYTWGEYNPLSWYSWGDGRDFFVMFVFGAWHWSIHTMYGEGEPIINDSAATENRGYPTAVAAMDACERYVARTKGE